jgi:hypothetical protein
MSLRFTEADLWGYQTLKDFLKTAESVMKVRWKGNERVERVGLAEMP